MIENGQKYDTHGKIKSSVQWKVDLESEWEIEKLGIQITRMGCTDNLLISTHEGWVVCCAWDYVVVMENNDVYILSEINHNKLMEPVHD